MKEFLSSNTFISELSTLITENSISIIEGICMWCEERNIEVEEVVPFIKSDKVLLSKIQDEAENLSLLKKANKLSNNLMEAFE